VFCGLSTMINCCGRLLKKAVNFLMLNLIKKVVDCHFPPLLFLGVAIFFLSFRVGSANDIITLNTTGKPPLNDKSMNGFMDQVSKIAFDRIGLTLMTVQLPAERGLINSNKGIVDGEMSRISGLQKNYPNLLIVPEKIMNWEFVAIGPEEIDTSVGWQSLKGKDVALINGWKILEKNVAPIASIIKVSSPEQLFVMLQRQRTDYILYERWGAAKYLMESSVKASVKMPPLAEREMYIYLHKKHKALIPKLADALRGLKEDGTYKKIREQALEKFLKVKN